jgi:putative Mn2+ efflux pump MntP
MMNQRKIRKSAQHRAVQLVMMLCGWALVISAPIVSWLPGPGGLLFFILGLGLILKNSHWARKQFARHSKRHPEYSLWIGWALRRKRFRKRPPFPPIKRDILRVFRRDDQDCPNF